MTLFCLPPVWWNSISIPSQLNIRHWNWRFFNNIHTAFSLNISLFDPCWAMSHANLLSSRDPLHLIVGSCKLRCFITLILLRATRIEDRPRSTIAMGLNWRCLRHLPLYILQSLPFGNECIKSLIKIIVCSLREWVHHRIDLV